jgi:hypothetical protein
MQRRHAQSAEAAKPRSLSQMLLIVFCGADTAARTKRA